MLLSSIVSAAVVAYLGRPARSGSSRRPRPVSSERVPVAASVRLQVGVADLSLFVIGAGDPRRTRPFARRAAALEEAGGYEQHLPTRARVGAAADRLLKMYGSEQLKIAHEF